MRGQLTCSYDAPSLTVNEFVTCTATVGGGAPTSWAWSSAEYRTSFSSSGPKTASVTVTNAGGSDSASRTLTVPPASP